MLTQALPRPVVAESIVLADGRHVTVRPVTPASKPLIAAAMTRLSPESIRRRFSRRVASCPSSSCIG
jgi:hypothetical protein